MAAEAELGKPVTYRELNELFADHVDGPTSKIWYTYKAGHSLPSQGSNKKPNANLAGAIELRWPNAVRFRDHVFWTLIDRILLTEENIHALMLELGDGTRPVLMGVMSTGDYFRWLADPVTETEALTKNSRFDDLAALVALLREAEMRQELARYNVVKAALLATLPILEKTPIIKPFAADLIKYILVTFKHYWLLTDGHYAHKPRLP